LMVIKGGGGGWKEKKKIYFYILMSTLKYHTTTTIFLCFTVSLSLFMPPSIRRCIKKCYQRVFVVISRRMRRRTLTIYS
jgi:hypothetical protein